MTRYKHFSPSLLTAMNALMYQMIVAPMPVALRIWMATSFANVIMVFVVLGPRVKVNRS